jgi:hypothetical protein
MVDANALLRRLLLVAVVSALSMVNVAYAHGGGHGSGGSSGSGSGSSGSSSGSGHSASSTSGGHSASASGKAATASKGSHSTRDPVSVSNSANATYQHVRVYRIFQQVPSTGYTTQYRDTNNEEWRRKHQRLFLGFIRY